MQAATLVPPRGGALRSSVSPPAELLSAFSGHSPSGQAPVAPSCPPSCGHQKRPCRPVLERNAAVAGARHPRGWARLCFSVATAWHSQESFDPTRTGAGRSATGAREWGPPSAAAQPFRGPGVPPLGLHSRPAEQSFTVLPLAEPLGRARAGKEGLLSGLEGAAVGGTASGHRGRQGGEGAAVRGSGAREGFRNGGDGGGKEALLPVLEHRRRTVTAALEDALQKHRVSSTYAGQVLRQLPHLLDLLLLHTVRLKSTSPELALEPFSSRAAMAVGQSRIAPTVRSLQRLGLSPGRTAHLVGTAISVASAGAQSSSPSSVSVLVSASEESQLQGSAAPPALLGALGDAMERLGQNLTWLHSVSKKGLRRPGQLAKLAEADGWALLHLPLEDLKERGQGLWSWLRFSGGMAEQWVHQVHCQPGLLTQPQGELAARLALLHDLAAQRLTLGPLRRASSAQQPWPTLQDGPAEESSSDRDGSGHAAGSWETLELEHDPAEGSSTAGAGLAGDRWYEVGDDGDPVEETGQESTLASDSTVFGMFSRHQTGDGWQRLGQMSDGGAPERTSDAHAHAAVASSEDGAPWRAPCYESSEDSVRLRASLALEGVPALSNAGAALVRRVVQRTPALLSSSVPVDDMQAKVAFLRDTLGVPAGHVGRVCVAHPRILLAHLRPPPEGTTQAKKGEAGDSPPSITRPTSNGYTRGVASPPPTRPTASAGVGAMRGCACWHALLLYLQRQGMSTEDVALMVQKHPLLLTLDLAVSVSPKMAYFRSSGMSPSSIRNMLLQAPHVLSYSLEGRIKPLVRLLDEQAGVGGDDLGALLCMHPDLLSSHSRLPRSLGFFRETVGLSARQLGLMLTSFPQLLGYSRAGLEGKWAFYTEQWGDDLQPLVEFPRFFSYSLESRIQLRTAVLEKEGLMDDFSLQRMLECSDEAFSSRVKTTLAKKLLSS